MSIDWCVLDLETTGPVADGSERIIELALVAVDEYGMHLDEWRSLVNPGSAANLELVGPDGVRGISAEMLEAAPTFKEIAGDVIRFLNDRRLVAHDARVKSDVLVAELRRIGVELDEFDVLCTTGLSTRAGIGLSLEGCCSVLGIENTEPGTAIGDARAAAEIFEYHLAVQHYPPGRATLFSVPGVFHSDAMIVPSNRTWTRSQAWLAEEPEKFVASAFRRDQRGVKDVLDLAEPAAVSPRDEEELSEFARIGHRCGITSPKCLEINYSYLRGLVSLAYADGCVSEAERTNLERICSMLGMDRAVLDSLLERERVIGRLD